MDNEIIESGLAENEKLMERDAIPFHLTRGKAMCNGLVNKGTIWIHLIYGEMKPFLDYLVKKYKIDKVIFTPVINENVLRRVHGFMLKSLDADNPDNPYGEEMYYLEGKWKIRNHTKKTDNGKL